MAYNANDIELLLKRIEEKAGLKIRYSNSADIRDKIKDDTKKHPPFGNDYLYKQLRYKLDTMAKEGESQFDLEDDAIDFLAKYVGFRDYKDFQIKKGCASVEELRKYFGDWYSCVRCNSGEPYILISPVKIDVKENVVYIELEGPERKFVGELEVNGERLYSCLKSDKGKNLYMVFKTGVVLTPKVLQGVFCGVSAGGDPIAGREVLIKKGEIASSNIAKGRKRIHTFLHSENENDVALGHYFSSVKDNTLRAGISSSFDIGDLKEYRRVERSDL